ncbi:S8 family serine peptidase [Paludifilum halophilum]|uniref:S8 family serine peptidase n=1 Tax=Paludifilum halophilum TaxID=1642702 RepID=UPI003F6AFD1D
MISVPSHAQTGEQADRYQKHIIVKFKEGTPNSEKAKAHRQNHATLKDRNNHPAINFDLVEVKGSKESAIKRYKEDY